MFYECDYELSDDDEAVVEPRREEPEGPATAEAADMAPVLIATRTVSIVAMPKPMLWRGNGTLKRPVELKALSKTKGASWVYLEASATEPRELYEALHDHGGVQGLLAASTNVPGRCAALLCKRRHAQLEPGVWDGAFSLGKGRGGTRVVDLVSQFLRAPTSYGDLELRKPAEKPGPLDLERAVKELQGLSDEDLVLMCGNARLKPALERTDLDGILLRCWSHIKVLRARRAAGGLVHEVATEQPKALPLDQFIGLESLAGELHDPTTGQSRRITYAEFLRDPELHLRFAACLLGAGGLGKTPLAKSTAVYLATAYQQMAYGTPPGRCYYIQANSVDTLRACGHLLKPYVPVFVDEFEASDVRQQGPLGENGLKVLCDVPEGGTLRVRFGSIVFPPSTPRLFAANCSSPDAWLRKLGADSVHLGAIKKRVAFFVVSKPLVAAGTKRSLGPLQEPDVMREALQRARAAM